jgi:hypothetical protein
MTENAEKPRTTLSKIIEIAKYVLRMLGVLCLLVLLVYLWDIRPIISYIAAGVFLIGLSYLIGIRCLIVNIFGGLFCLVLLVFPLARLQDHFPAFWPGKIAPGITKEKILSLKIGMDKETVVNILVDPEKSVVLVSGLMILGSSRAVSERWQGVASESPSNYP